MKLNEFFKSEHWSADYYAQTDGIHLIIERHDKQSINVNWEVIQQIKNEMLGEDVCCIEIYPTEHDVVNEINRRHLWVVPEAAVDKFNLAKR